MVIIRYCRSWERRSALVRLLACGSPVAIGDDIEICFYDGWHDCFGCILKANNHHRSYPDMRNG